MKEIIKLLGRKGKDKVTKTKGVITSVCFDLYGCIQVILTPEVDKEGKRNDSHWYDIKRIELTKEKEVMEIPDFSWYTTTKSKGPAEKPVY